MVFAKLENIVPKFLMMKNKAMDKLDDRILQTAQ